MSSCVVVVVFVLRGWLVISSFHAVDVVCLCIHAWSVQYVHCAKQGQVRAKSCGLQRLRRRRCRSPARRLCSAWRLVSFSQLAIGHSRSIVDTLLQDTNLERAQRNARRLLATSSNHTWNKIYLTCSHSQPSRPVGSSWFFPSHSSPFCATTSKTSPWVYTKYG